MKTSPPETIRHDLADGYRVEIFTYPSGNRVAIIPSRFKGVPYPPKPIPRRGEVNWYIPFTAVHPLTVGGAPLDAIWIDVSSSVNAYYGAMVDIWARGETFAVLEHDVVCRPDVIRELEECPEPWCLYGYDDICHVECREAWRNALGCTRFRKELIAAVPDALTSVTNPEEWDWHNICDRLGERLRAAGFTHHFHEPAIGHHRGVQNPDHERDYRAKHGILDTP